jgi:hypothetical protein
MVIVASVLIISFLSSWTVEKSNPYYGSILRALPGYFLICLGCYGLIDVGSGLLRLRDCPEEQKNLLEDIQRAKKNLGAKNFKFD